jgi:membrane protease YdiL (CAAX protease family)
MAAEVDEKLIMRLAVIDGVLALFILVVSVAFASIGSDSVIPWLPLSSILVAISALVGWRGAADARRILRGDRRWWRPPVEGFLTVAGIVFVWIMAGAITTAIAAGSIYDGAENWSPREWLTYVTFAASVASASGMVGAMLGMIIGSLNRAILRRAAP